MKNITRLALHCAVAVALLTSAGFAADRPNLIFINSDDLGYADIGPFGSTINRTPNLDRMAKEGRKLTCHYAAPVCSPSRAALMTGCYPKRVLPIPGVLFPGAAVGLNPKEHTVAELLKDAGYTTAIIGKWHLGDQPEFLPRRRGFDFYLGLPYSNDMGPGEEGAKSSLGDPLPKPRANAAKAADEEPNETGITGRRQPPLPLVRNETVIERVGVEGQAKLMTRYTDEAVNFIKANKDRKFFLYLPYNAVHFPIYPGKSFAGKSSHGLYSDWVEEVDWSVGRVLDTLRELKLDANTLVIFSSDNGGTPRAVNAPLRGFKGSTWEGGMREPTVAWWPGRIPAGTATGEITAMMDILPTFVKLAGGAVPADHKLDGRDIWPVLAGEPGAKSPHDVFFFFHGLKLEGVRSGPWKLRLASAGAGPMKKKTGPPAPLLFNLADDIGESRDVAAANPEIVQRLQALAETMKDDLGLIGTGPGCRPLGRVAAPQPLIGSDGRIRAGFAPEK